jgi:hypothetical protein
LEILNKLEHGVLFGDCNAKSNNKKRKNTKHDFQQAVVFHPCLETAYRENLLGSGGGDHGYEGKENKEKTSTSEQC